SPPQSLNHIRAAEGRQAEPRFEPTPDGSAPGEEEDVAGADVGEAGGGEPAPGFGWFRLPHDYRRARLTLTVQADRRRSSSQQGSLLRPGGGFWRSHLSAPWDPS